MSEKRARNGKITPTPKEKKIAREYVRTGNKSEAYRLAYNAQNMAPKSVHREALATLSKPQVVREIDKAMQRAGLDDELVSQIHQRNLTQDDNLNVSQQAVRDYHNVKGHNVSKEVSSTTQIAFVINVQDKRGEGAK